jgi:hypothetical protein
MHMKINCGLWRSVPWSRTPLLLAVVKPIKWCTKLNGNIAIKSEDCMCDRSVRTEYVISSLSTVLVHEQCAHWKPSDVHPSEVRSLAVCGINKMRVDILTHSIGEVSVVLTVPIAICHLLALEVEEQVVSFEPTRKAGPPRRCVGQQGSGSFSPRWHMILFAATAPSSLSQHRRLPLVDQEGHHLHRSDSSSCELPTPCDRKEFWNELNKWLQFFWTRRCGGRRRFA